MNILDLFMENYAIDYLKEYNEEIKILVLM